MYLGRNELLFVMKHGNEPKKDVRAVSPALFDSRNACPSPLSNDHSPLKLILLSVMVCNVKFVLLSVNSWRETR